MKFSDFDTLIDFETGILGRFRPTLRRYGVSKTDGEVLAAFAAVEDKYQRTNPEKTFTEMLPLIYRDLASDWGVEFHDEDAEGFRRSIRSWPPSPATVEAPRELGRRYRLVGVTNATDVARFGVEVRMVDGRDAFRVRGPDVRGCANGTV